jgi:hypothetical protein
MICAQPAARSSWPPDAKIRRYGNVARRASFRNVRGGNTLRRAALRCRRGLSHRGTRRSGVSKWFSRETVDCDRSASVAIDWVDHWLSCPGPFSVRVRVTRTSICSSVIVRAAPGRGRSSRASSRPSRNRVRHLRTDSRDRPVWPQCDDRNREDQQQAEVPRHPAPVQGPEQAGTAERGQPRPRETPRPRRAGERPAQDLGHPPQAPLLPLARRETRQGDPHIEPFSSWSWRVGHGLIA